MKFLLEIIKKADHWTSESFSETGCCSHRESNPERVTCLCLTIHHICSDVVTVTTGAVFV
jgi:hypothetical protein